MKTIDFIRAMNTETDRKGEMSGLLKLLYCPPYCDEADLIKALYVLAARDARTISPNEENAEDFCQTVCHLPAYIVASFTRSHLLPYVAFLLHHYFRTDGGHRGLRANRERCMSIAELYIRSWKRLGGRRPSQSASNMGELMGWLIDGVEPTYREEMSLIKHWPEAVMEQANRIV